MKNSEQKIIDSHLHLDHIHTKHPDRIRWMRERGIIPISWAFAMNIENRESLAAYLRTQADLIHRLNGEGMKCFFLSGIHPRNIPPDLDAEDVKALLSPFLDDPLCLGIGEIGLELGSPREKEIFSAQLAMGEHLREKGKCLGVHTPRENKPKITREILSVLEKYPGLEEITVIDHCMPETIARVLEKGYRAGVTLSPIKASFRDAEEILRRHSEDLNRIMCNTDSGTVFHEDVFRLHCSEDFREVQSSLTFENALQFFRL
ncbi:TatD family hydrolase [Desulfobacterales bacterium HSG2]|nr:TatD family hydrolase [Desulfobacterales bacterium HSG2]